jgi:LPXTG-motif cell wall-anchored protein
VWAPVVGGIAILLAAGGAGLYARRRRFGLSH